ncbi:MAG TPA: zf-HC2 domain-containing protein [Roseimicrobium sp.]|nr:zf-HC2 domain-containing protein [Roseimicrobium sp.]
MNHPANEDWMSYLYGELPPDRHAELDRHLDHCPACATRVNAWRGAQRDLDAWEIATPPTTVRRGVPVVLQWAAAAAVVLCAGWWAGSASAPRVDESALEARLASSIELRVRTETAKVQQSYAVQLEKDREAMLDTVQRIEAQRITDYALLRQDLESIATLAEDGLTVAHQQIVQLSAAQGTATTAPEKTSQQ